MTATLYPPAHRCCNLLSQRTCFVGNGTWKGVEKYSSDLFLVNIIVFFLCFFFFFNLLLNIFFQLWGFVLLFAWVF